MNNIHNQSIPVEVLTQVNAKIAEAIGLLKPYTLTLTPEDRKNMLKLGDKSSSFVDKAFENTKTNPEFIPAFLTASDFEIDITDSKNLIGSASLATQLLNAIDDTMMVAGSEAYYAALYYYSSVQQAAGMNIPGAKAIYEELKKRFPSKSRSTDSADSAAAK
ncbi:MAG: hypothetical protein PHR83_14730 [Paludibacter sp.]|nr:hypothetical protein [Paludibacter sp.]